MNISEKFIVNLQRQEDRVILAGLSADGKISWQRTKKELLEQTYHWIGALKSYGINKGDRVILSLGKSPSLFPLHIALLAVGAIIVPLNPALTSIEIQQVLNKAESRLAITKPEILTNSPHLVNSISGSWWVDCLTATNLEKCVEFNNVLSNSSPVTEICPIDKEDIALLVFTSGTTGKPKGVGITHNSLISNLETLLISTWNFSEQDSLLHALPPHHIHGLGLGIYGSLLAGNSCFLLEKFEPLTVLSAITEYKISLFMGVPTMYHRMLSIEGDFDLSSIRLFISGSAPLSKETFSQFNTQFGFTILERYGLTETLFNASNPLNKVRKAGTVGLPLSGVDICIVDPQTLIPVKENSIGEIWVKGENVFSGYYKDPENTSLAFHNGWFRTGDLGQFDSDGYLSIVGRIKELIIVGGSNVTPGEIETVLEKNPLVLECAVTSIPDIDLGEKIVACIVTNDKTDTKALEDNLKVACQEQLAAYKRPKQYCFVQSLPRNAMGKLERNKLKDSLTKSTT